MLDFVMRSIAAILAISLLGYAATAAAAQAQVAPAPLVTPAPVPCASVHTIMLSHVFSKDWTYVSSYWLFWTGTIMPDGIHYHVGGFVGFWTPTYSYSSITKLHKLEWKDGNGVNWCVTSPRLETVSTPFDPEIQDRKSEPEVPRTRLPDPTQPTYITL